MSCTKEITLWCDAKIPDKDTEQGYDCPIWEQYSASSFEEARKEAKVHRWTHKDGKDFCPRCSKINQESKEVSS